MQVFLAFTSGHHRAIVRLTIAEKIYKIYAIVEKVKVNGNVR